MKKSRKCRKRAIQMFRSCKIALVELDSIRMRLVTGVYVEFLMLKPAIRRHSLRANISE